MKIGQFVQKLYHVFDFQDGGLRHLGFLKCAKLKAGLALTQQKPQFSKIVYKSVDGLKSYSKFTVSKMAAAAILNFNKFTKFKKGLTSTSQKQQSLKILCKLVDWLKSCSTFSIFKMAASAILDFLKCAKLKAGLAFT
jgi:uncharacterized protein (DUF2164 family)